DSMIAEVICLRRAIAATRYCRQAPGLSGVGTGYPKGEVTYGIHLPRNVHQTAASRRGNLYPQIGTVRPLERRQGERSYRALNDRSRWERPDRRNGCDVDGQIS